jgi:hypothetical protein
VTTLTAAFPGITLEQNIIPVAIAYTESDLTATLCFDLAGDEIWIDVTRDDLEEGMDTPTLQVIHTEHHVTFVLPLAEYAATVPRDILLSFLTLSYEHFPKGSEFVIDQSEFDQLLGDSNGDTKGPTV